ncbi:MAG: UDP-N-acetylmuramate dehydrogenase [Phycisphaerales bacterium]
MLSTSGIFSDLDVDVTLDAPIGSMTWYGIGGRADVLLSPHSIEALATLIRRCRRTRTPLRILGKGANLLVADEGVDGVVVRLDAPLFQETRFEEGGEETVLRAGGGADLARITVDCARRGLAGFSHMAGIPGTIGGGLRMNAGGAFGCISDGVQTVTCLTRTGDVATYSRDELTFDYRRSSLTDPVILGAAFSLSQSDPITVRNRVKEIFAFKKSTQPLAEHSAGCAFRNAFDPEHEETIRAGKLIDHAGLKGLTVGGARVSDRHANFITVDGSARADHVLQLMGLVRQRVFEHAGIMLENEVVIWRRGDVQEQVKEDS